MPDCFSNDGVAPDEQSRAKQSKACATCPHAVWGTKDTDSGKGTACAPVTRLAVSDPGMTAEVMLVRVPPASRKAFSAVVEIAKQRGVPYNAIAMKMSFDKEAATPKLVFTPVGFLNSEDYAKVEAAYDTQLVKDIVGHAEKVAKVDASADVSDEELQAAIAGNKTAKAAPAETAKPADDSRFSLAAAVNDMSDEAEQTAAVEQPKATKPKAASKPKAEPKAEPKVLDTDSLTADLDAFLLGDGTDD